MFYFNAWDEGIPSGDFSQIEGYDPKAPGMNNKTRPTITQNLLPSYNPGLVPIAGRVFWEQATTGGVTNTEYLDHYRITIFNASDTENPIDDTGIIYVGSQEKDSIYYLADLSNAATSSNYIIHIDAVTRNGYEW